MEISVAPVISSYKYSFVKRRWLETWLGGIRLITPEQSFVPLKVMLFQVVLFLLPVIFAIPFMLDIFDATPLSVCLGYGLVLSIWSALLQLFFFKKGHSALDITVGLVSHVLAEEDESDFESLQGIIVFVSDKKSLREAFTGSIVSFLLGLAGLYINCYNPVYNPLNPTVSIIIKAFGWLSFCLAHFSLNIRCPVEIAKWRSVPIKENRSLYICLLCAIQKMLLLFQVHTLLCISLNAVLPILWSLGILPSIETFFEWLAEQALVHLFGGSVAPSTSRLVEHLLVSAMTSGFISLLYLYLSAESTIAAAFPLSYILSIGFSPVSRFVGQRRIKPLKVIPKADAVQFYSKTSPIFFVKDTRSRTKKALLLQRLVGFCICTAIGVLVPVAIPYEDYESNLDIIAILIGVSAFAGFLCSAIQKPFFLGILRVPLFIKCQENRKPTLAILFAALAWSTRILLLLWISWVFMIGAEHQNSDTIMRGLALSTTLVFTSRVSITHPIKTAMVTVVLQIARPPTRENSPLFAFMLCSFILSRVFIFFSKLHFVWLHVWTANREEKFRIKKAAKIQLAFLPTIDILAVSVATLLDAPIVPFLGTSFFVVGFPRPKRLWPNPANCSIGFEGAYYEHLIPQIAAVIPDSIWYSGLALPSREEATTYAIRLEKMIVWICVTESGLGYATAQIKGLELQEPTSCHHVEAGNLDDLINLSLNNKSDLQINRISVPCCNLLADASPLNYSIEPICSISLTSYSPSNIRLTGILDNADFLKTIDKALWITLVFVFKAEQKQRTINIEKMKLLNTDDIDLASVPIDWISFLEDSEKNPSTRYNGPAGPSGPEGDDFDIDALLDEIDDFDFGIQKHNNDLAIKVAQETTYSSASVSITPEEETDEGRFRAENSSISTGLLQTSSLIPNTTPNTKANTRDDNSQSTDSNKIDSFNHFVASIHAIINSIGLVKGSVVLAGGDHVCDCYVGKYPRTLELEYLESQEEIFNLSLAAYRLAFKLALDSSIYGDPDSSLKDYQSILASLVDYQENWHLGIPTESSWSDALRSETENLLSLSKNASPGSDGKETLLQLSLHKEKCYFLQCRQEFISAFWASLELELYYCTNDDDERYSIQAHPTLLRNLTVQAADPPLGYPVYSLPRISMV